MEKWRDVSSIGAIEAIDRYDTTHLFFNERTVVCFCSDEEMPPASGTFKREDGIFVHTVTSITVENGDEVDRDTDEIGVYEWTNGSGRPVEKMDRDVVATKRRFYNV